MTDEHVRISVHVHGQSKDFSTGIRAFGDPKEIYAKLQPVVDKIEAAGAATLMKKLAKIAKQMNAAAKKKQDIRDSMEGSDPMVTKTYAEQVEKHAPGPMADTPTIPPREPPAKKETSTDDEPLVFTTDKGEITYKLVKHSGKGRAKTVIDGECTTDRCCYPTQREAGKHVNTVRNQRIRRVELKSGEKVFIVYTPSFKELVSEGGQ